MGSFRGHVVPGSLFLVVGIWHSLNSIFRFVSRPRDFKGSVWHPVPGVSGRLRYLELYVITLGALFDLCIEFFYSPHFHYFADGGLNAAHLNNFEHSAMLLMFFLLGVLGLVTETTKLLSLPEGTLNILASMAFTSEFLLFYFHSTTHRGLEGRYHELLVYLIGLCILTTVLGAAYPNSFAIDLASGLSIILQGLWFYVTAFALYGSWTPEGCSSGPGGVKCDTRVYDLRGQSLANSQLSFMVTIVVTLTLAAYALAARLRGHQNEQPVE